MFHGYGELSVVLPVYTGHGSSACLNLIQKVYFMGMYERVIQVIVVT